MTHHIFRDARIRVAAVLASLPTATVAMAQEAPTSAPMTQEADTSTAPALAEPSKLTDTPTNVTEAALPDVVVEQKTPVPKPPRIAKHRPAAAPALMQSVPAETAPKPETAPSPDVTTEPQSSTPTRSLEQSVPTPLAGSVIEGRTLQQSKPRSSDAAALLANTAGVSLAQGGGVSSLPVLNGLADDRVKILINGRESTSACGNHMNPPLSYADGAQVTRIRVMPGSAPVSQGGDSIGGVISVDTLPPAFTTEAQGAMAHASISSVYRSNGDGISTSASAHAAAGNMSMAYTGAFSRAANVQDGAGRDVLSSEYEAHNHTLALAARDTADHVYVLEAGVQHIPYQGFVNQPMDMVLNDSVTLAARYDGVLAWGKLSLAANYQHVRHGMNFLEDKIAAFEKAGFGDNNTMPMNTRGNEGGYTAKADISLTPQDTLRLGNELHLQRLDDRWPAVCFTPFCGMGPSTYVNINDGERDRLGTFAEWERAWSAQLSTIVGLRTDVVRMTTGDVAPYERLDGDIDTAAADAFNAQDRARTDVNVDWSLLARYEATRQVSLELAAARKTRSPNLYERYAWGESSMTSQMTTWFGDANGYVGNLDLKPEVAHRLSFSAGWHDAARQDYALMVTPFYTRVEDFITAELYAPEGWVSGFNQLKFVNHDATLYGVDISGRARLGEGDFGSFALRGVASYVHGEDRVTHTPLYHMMPWNGRLGLEHTSGRWTNLAEVEVVGAKERVDAARLEPATAGHTLFNLRSSYAWNDLRVDAGVENVFDTLYFAPLGGTDYTRYLAPGHAVAGTGRTFFLGLTANF